MDNTTIATYDAHAASFVADQRAKAPRALYRLITAWFHTGGASADIGCGSGRDTAWLNNQGFPTVGYDASAGMLAAARRAYPNLDLRRAALPDLEPIARASYDNVLCSAVLMHLPADALRRAPQHLARILRPGGRLVLTYRASRVAHEREDDGRLYTPIDGDGLALLLKQAGLPLIRREQTQSDQRPDVTWNVLIAERAL